MLKKELEQLVEQLQLENQAYKNAEKNTMNIIMIKDEEIEQFKKTIENVKLHFEKLNGYRLSNSQRPIKLVNKTPWRNEYIVKDYELDYQENKLFNDNKTEEYQPISSLDYDFGF